jgi:uncharacterized membrane protein YfcA
MTVLVFTLLIAAASTAAGLLGALTGLGGGVVIVPLLTLLFRVDIRYAIGASLVSVIATSSGAAAAYVREGYTNLRVGVFLEIATTLGAVFGGVLTAHLAPHTVERVFAFVLLVSAALSLRGHGAAGRPAQPDRLATRLNLDGTIPTPAGRQPYHVRRVPAAFLLMLTAGALSSLLGIGSGAVKVLALDRVMQLPFKVSTTTSNFMIGVTAATGASVYLKHGYIDPGLTMPVMLGVLAGSMSGARLLTRIHSALLRYVFAAVIVALAAQMLYDAGA